MKLLKLLSVLALLSGALIVYVIVRLPEPRVGILTITFDDGNSVQYEHGLPLARKHGIVGTLFVPTMLMRGAHSYLEQSWKMTWAEVAEFQDAGWEIGGHGRTHLNLTSMPPEYAASEVRGSREDIQALLGVSPVSFASPFGGFNDDTVPPIMDSFSYHLTLGSNGWKNPLNGVDPRNIARREVVNTMNAAEVCGEMVESSLNGTWLVLLFHGIVDTEPGDYEISSQEFDRILACASRLQEAGVIEVLTVRDAFHKINKLN